MALRRYRSIEEMPGPPPLGACDPANLRAAIEVSAVCYALNPWRFPPGVHKHASVAEAASERERWLAQGSASTEVDGQRRSTSATEAGPRGSEKK
jgi:hypothetical protein